MLAGPGCQDWPRDDRWRSGATCDTYRTRLQGLSAALYYNMQATVRHFLKRARPRPAQAKSEIRLPELPARRFPALESRWPPIAWRRWLLHDYRVMGRARRVRATPARRGGRNHSRAG